MFANCCNSGKTGGLEMEPKIKVVYFDIPGARGDPIRLALKVLNRPFEDCRITFAQWADGEKAKAPSGQLPYIELPNGQKLSETIACLLYVSQNSTLYPIDYRDRSHENALKVAQIHQVLRLCDSLYATARPVYAVPREEQHAKMSEVVKANAKLWDCLEQAVAKTQGGSGFVCCNALTIADLYIYAMIGYMKCQFGQDSLELTYRAIGRVCAAVRKTPQVADYLALHNINY